jgi:hypothetical protein
MLLRAHSRQKMSPWEHDTGSIAGSRHSRQEPKGRKESRVRRAEEVFHAALARARSWEVKTARDVFLLPRRSEVSFYVIINAGNGAYCVT